MNVTLIIYYPAAKSISKFNHLKNSLAETLTQFYPLAGRYMKDSHLVDCSGQGAEFVQAQVDIRLNELLVQGLNLKVELLNNFLPIPLGAADEITDPLLAIQVNVFDCGCLAIGVCVPHRVADMSTISTFVKEWANVTASWGRLGIDSVSPNFDSAFFFPGKNVSGLNFGLSRSKENIQVHKIVTKIFCFNRKAISSIKREATIVQSVFGIIWKALVDINRAAKHEHSSEFIVLQPVNIRERTFPPLAKNSFGNLYILSTSQYVASESEMEFQDFANLLGNSVKSTLEDCRTILSRGEDGQMMIRKPYIELSKSLSDSEMVKYACMFSSWSKFSLYEADFGWGQPIWVSKVNIPLKNLVVLIDDKEGDGIEAWVSLDEKDMPKFEQNCIIKNFTT